MELSEALLASRDLVSAAGGGSTVRRDVAGGVESWNLSPDAQADLADPFWNDALENTSDVALTTATSQ